MNNPTTIGPSSKNSNDVRLFVAAKEVETVDEVKELKTDKPASKKIGPAAKKIILEENIDPNDVKPSGKGERITKADLINHLDSNNAVSKSTHSIDLSSNSENKNEKKNRNY